MILERLAALAPQPAPCETARSFRLMDELDLAGKRVLVRLDLNAPVADGRVTSNARLQAALPTIQSLVERRAAVTLLSHLGRPREGRPDPAFSMEPVARRLTRLLGRTVRLEPDWPDRGRPEPGEILMAENVRFLPGETANDPELGRRMAEHCDVFVMDAFGTAHRAHASTHAVAEQAPAACAGPLLARELECLGRALAAPRRPLTAVVGGSKVSTKLGVLKSLLGLVDLLIVGGGIANTFLAAIGHNVGVSLHEPDLVPMARAILAKAASNGVVVPLPTDLVCARRFASDARSRVCLPDDIAPDEMILDVGPQTAKHYGALLRGSKTIVWNGPVGVFELDRFGVGTRVVAKAVADSWAYSIAGGGDTLAAIDKYGVAGSISYISTGGGAFLEMVQGRVLPAVAALEARAG